MHGANIAVLVCLPDQVEGRTKAISVYGFHSLRHSFASHCAEAGVPKAVVQSILGDDCDILDAYYTHIGEEAQQKAIAAIAGEVGVINPQDRINRTPKYTDTLPDTPKYKIIRELLSSETESALTTVGFHGVNLIQVDIDVSVFEVHVSLRLIDFIFCFQEVEPIS